jgi:hypothetical protein
LELVILLIILDTSFCELSFALMNRIRTYLQNRLGVATLKNLMCISSLGPSITNFDPKPILEKWLEASFMQKNGCRGRSLQGKLNALMADGSSSPRNRPHESFTKHKIEKNGRPRVTSSARREYAEGHATHFPPDLKTWRSHTHLATQCGILLPVFRALVFGLALCFGKSINST